MATQKGPGKGELKRYLNAGLTQAEIVEAWEKDTGVRVARSTIAMLIGRLGLKSAHQRPSYPDMLPWVVSTEHRHHIDARLLRLEGRRRAGGKLNPAELTWLEGWKQELADKRAVIYYDRESPEGFHWLSIEDAGDWGDTVDPNYEPTPRRRPPRRTTPAGQRRP